MGSGYASRNVAAEVWKGDQINEQRPKSNLFPVLLGNAGSGK